MKRPRGRPPLRLGARERDRLRRLYLVKNLSTRALAAVLGISETNVRRRLRAAGIERRPVGPPAKISVENPARLYSDVILYGVEGAAKRRGVVRRTLQLHLARLRGKAKT